jgi:hypothetical protein
MTTPLPSQRPERDAFTNVLNTCKQTATVLSLHELPPGYCRAIVSILALLFQVLCRGSTPCAERGCEQVPSQPWC